MEINHMPRLNSQKTEGKKGVKAPKKGFQDVMKAKQQSKKSQKKPSLFDLSLEAENRRAPFLKKNQESFNIQQQNTLNLSFQLAIEKGEEAHFFLPKEMITLMEKISQCIQIESQKGITTTTITIDREGSLFHGSEITLEHYDTAPHSFNLQLIGSPEGVNLFSTHLTSLQMALASQSSLEKIDIRILSPILKQEAKSSLRNGKEKKESSFKKENERLAQKISF